MPSHLHEILIEMFRGRPGCTDLEQLNVWVRQAATANTIEDLHDPERSTDQF